MKHSQTIAKLNDKGEFNSVIAHCFDVAALAEQLTQRQSDRVQDRLCEGLALDHKSMVAWVALIAGLHDLCKLSWAFQLMPSFGRPGIGDKYEEINGDIDTALQQRIVTFRKRKEKQVSPVQHAILLAVVLPPLLVEITGIEEDTAIKLVASAAGHHALFVTKDIFRTAKSYLAHGKYQESEFNALQRDLVKQLWSHLGLCSTALPSKVEFGCVHQISGLIQQSDHIGSREKQMPLQNGLCRPFAETREKAIDILNFYKYSTPKVTERPTFEQLGFKPRAMQEIIAGLDLSRPFALFVKAGTGNGKTAAAVQAALNGEGFVFGANNQSTANSIYRSVKDILHKVQATDEQALALAHSNRQSVIEDVLEELVEDDPSHAAELRSTFELQSEGLMDALTSKHVVATIDQVLMSVFNDGRAAFRLHWLTNKINILDEVHSLDGRLEALLLVFLKILGRFKTPVILLSATISSRRMNKLLKAWADGAGIDYRENEVALQSDDQVILVNEKDVCVHTVDKNKTPEKVVKVNHFDDVILPQDTDGSVLELTGAEQMILSRSKEVDRVVWMGATANEVRASYQKLKPVLEKRGIKAICFHAQFNPLDRIDVTKCVFDAFGQNAPENSKVVLFTTNVFRESLNLDCDELITYSGLIPEIIQAIGRVHRFNRPNRRCKTPQIHIARPCLTQTTPQRLSFGNADYFIQCYKQTASRNGRPSDFGFRAFSALKAYAILSDLKELRLPFDAQHLVDRCDDLSDITFPSNLPVTYRPYWEAFQARQQDAIKLEGDTIAKQVIPTDFSIHQTEFDFDFLGRFTTDKLEKKPKHKTRFISGTISFFVQEGEDASMVKRNSNLSLIAKHTVSVSNKEWIAGFVQSQLVPDEWKEHKVLKNVARIVAGVPSFVQGDNGKVYQIYYSRECGLEITS